jgi:anthranilate phosphoribosyltransferase
VRTVFNILGPLTNPAAPPFQLIGAYSRETAKLMAEALAGLDIERAFVVHGEPGWDEATPAGDFVLFDVRPGSVTETTRSPADYGLDVCAPEALKGGDAEHNAQELVRVFSGEDKGAHRDALLMGTSLMLEVRGVAQGPVDGVRQAAAAIDDGRAADFLARLKAHFVDWSARRWRRRSWTPTSTNRLCHCASAPSTSLQKSSNAPRRKAP